MLLIVLVVAATGVVFGICLARFAKWSAFVLSVTLIFAEITAVSLAALLGWGIFACVASCVIAVLAISFGWLAYIFFVNVKEQNLGQEE